MQSNLRIGCVADDYTGASDIASFFTQGGLQTVLSNGIPDETRWDNVPEVIVIALKTRTMPTNDAVGECMEAFDWLRAQGAGQLYFKYCSTFDSTPKGNIGPVIDAALERYHFPYTIICPALPVNGRTVRDGILYVDGTPLSHSPMKHHPLTPMWESNLTKLMKAQSSYPCYHVGVETMEQPSALTNILSQKEPGQHHFTLATDYYLEEHGALVANAFSHLPFLTGGSGLALHIAKKISGDRPIAHPYVNVSGTQRLLLAGSCSVATQGQVRNYLQQGGLGYQLDPDRLLSGEPEAERALHFVLENFGKDVLIYSSGSSGQPVSQHSGAAQALESAMASLAKQAAGHGINRLVVAGGETSGAVVQALGYRSFYIGENVAPGVPVMIPTHNTELRIVLKSGNFGSPLFLCTALKEDHGYVIE